MDGIRTRTTTDVVYETLQGQIVSLEILPGTKLSETEVARRFGVSRQPVRNAFTKLGNEDLLLIRPQKATEVRGFSMDRLERARLVRRAVELEVIHEATKIWDAECEDKLAENLSLQEKALGLGDVAGFHALDYDFHKSIYCLGGNPLAFDVMVECKQKVDRLCMLALEEDREAEAILADHHNIAKGLASRDVAKGQAAMRKHLSRLDSTITFIRDRHPEYFE